MITLRRLAKHCGERAAATNLSFEVKPGTVTGFPGPNGEGKPTTIRMIMGAGPVDLG